MTSKPASRSARATILAPRSCPSSPGLATTTRMRRSLIDRPGGPDMAPRPPTLGRAPAKPWRASGLTQDVSSPGPGRGDRRRRRLGGHGPPQRLAGPRDVVAIAGRGRPVEALAVVAKARD